MVLPATLPAPFADIVRQCLKRDPARRPTIEDIQRQIGPVSAAATTSVQVPILLPPEPEELSPPHVASEAPAEATALLPVLKRRSLVPAGVTILLVLIVVWAGLRWPDSQAYSRSVGPARATAGAALPGATPAGTVLPRNPAATEPPPNPTAELSSGESNDSAALPSTLATLPSNLPATSADDTAAAASAETQPANRSSFVLHEEAPEVAASALKTIRGHIKFAVRVRVDGSGNVEHISLASRSPSRYFKRLAFESARKWKFVAADGEDSRQWLLWFDFTRHGITIEAPPRDGSPRASDR